MSQNVIELNGKRYDALTGAFLGKSGTPANHTATPRRHGSSGRTIDGVIRPAHSPKEQAAGRPSQTAKHAAAAVSSPASAKALRHVPAAAKAAHAAVHHVPRASHSAKAANKSIAPALEKAAKAAANPVPTAAQHHAGHAHMAEPHQPRGKDVQRHQPEHTKTLMRRTVHKPELQMKPAIRPQGAAEVPVPTATSALAKRSVSHIDPTRQERARAVLKHAAVQRHHIAQGRQAASAVTSGAAVPVIAVHPQPLHTYNQATHPVPAKPANMFEHAMKHARSHEQRPFPRRRIPHSRAFNVMAAVAAFVVIGSFIAYLNMPNIQLHVASVQAGFHATMPAYKPTGYALRGGVHHNGGTVSMTFTSGDSSFQVTQQSSNWDSQALLDNTLALTGAHKTIQRNGRTIFIYDDNGSTSAAWVTGSVRYDITGNASLTTDQLADIASSM